MSFDWSLALLSLAGGLILLIAAIFSMGYEEKSIFAPATAMLITWGGGLVILSFLPLMGFYHLSAEAVLLYVIGAGWFAFVAVLTSWVLNRYTTQKNQLISGTADKINYSRLLLLWALLAVFTYPMALLEVLSFGSNMSEISYNIRRASLSGESVLNPIVSNIFIFLGVLANIALFGVIQKKIKLMSFIVLAVPFVVISLIVTGRSGLVSLILGWLVILAVFSDKLKLRFLALPILFLFFVIFFGGVWVKKFDVQGQSVGNVFEIFADHIFSYLFQGPVLFSQHLTGEINVDTKWDFLNSFCHMASKIGICTPLSLHQDFSEYGIGRVGNVYSIYYAIVPIYGFLGLAVVFGMYAIFLQILFRMMRAKKVFAVAVYPLMFSAIVLSLYKDGVGNSLYFLVKAFLFCVFIKFFCMESLVRLSPRGKVIGSSRFSGY